MSVRSEIYSALVSISGIGEVTHNWPKEFVSWPIVHYGIQDRVPLKNFTYDQESEVVVKISVWNKTEVSTLAMSISQKMSTLGYIRTMEMDVSALDVELNRIDMRFKALK